MGADGGGFLHNSVGMLDPSIGEEMLADGEALYAGKMEEAEGVITYPSGTLAGRVGPASGGVLATAC